MLKMSTTVPLLVSCEWLNEKINSGNLGNIVIIDVSWSSTRDCYEEYKKQHIPGASHIDVLAADHTDVYPRNIPDSESFTQLAQAAGVLSTSHIIIYSNSDRAGYFLAGRGWWTFRYFGHKQVSILDGGLPKWLKHGFPVTDTPSIPQSGNFVAQINKSIHKSFEEVKQNTESGHFQVIDSRANSAYSDDCIPGAKNLVMADLVDVDNGVLKSAEDLKSLFSSSGIDLSVPLAIHCNSGMSSCAVAFTAEYLGANNVSVYHGGFTEWKKRRETR